MAPKKAPATVDMHRMQGKSAPELPPPFENVLPSGLPARWRMPDVFTLLAFEQVIPDPTTQAVIRLLNEEKSLTHDTDPRKFLYDAQTIRGMYGLAAAMLETPRLDAGREYGDGNGTLGRREIGYWDVVRLYQLFRVSTRGSISAPAHATEPSRPADAARDSGDLREDASGADGDS